MGDNDEEAELSIRALRRASFKTQSFEVGDILKANIDAALFLCYVKSKTECDVLCGDSNHIEFLENDDLMDAWEILERGFTKISVKEAKKVSKKFIDQINKFYNNLNERDVK